MHLLIKPLCLQWQSGYSDTFPMSQWCHCKRGSLYWYHFLGDRSRARAFLQYISDIEPEGPSLVAECLGYRGEPIKHGATFKLRVDKNREAGSGKIFRWLKWLICTEMRFILCTWFGEFCSCCSLTALPGPAWVLLNWICKDLISSLYLNKDVYLIGR